MSDGQDNTAEIDKATRGYGRVRLWYRGWLALMLLAPLTCFAGMGRQDNVGLALMMFGVLAPVVALGGLMLMGSDLKRAKRRVKLAEEFDLLGLQYIDQPDMAKLRFLGEYQVFADSHTQLATSLGRGKYREDDLLALDFSCAWGEGRWGTSAWQTIFVLPDAVRNVPGMVVQPQGYFSKGNPLAVKGEEAFNRTYSLGSQFFEDAPRFIGHDLAALCVAEKTLCFEVRNGDLVVYWQNKLLDPPKLLDALKTAVVIGRLLRAKRS